MKLNDVLLRAAAWYAAGKCIYLKSPPGRGKTTTIMDVVPQIAKRTNKRLGISVINGAALTITDATGYLVPTQREIIGKDGVTHKVAFSQFTKPFWWITSEGKPLEDYDGGIIFVDEADKCGLDEKKILGEAALSGRLASHQLPPGWVVWMAGNRAEDRSGSTKELDHLINRRIEIDITDDMESWKDWCFTHGVMPETITFGEQNLNILFESKVPEKQGPWCTPRSLVELDKYLQVLRGEGEIPVDDPVTCEEIAGAIGSAAAAQYLSCIKLGIAMPKFEDIVKEPKKVRVPDGPDARMLVCYTLAARVTSKTADPIVTYMERMPPEFAVTFAKAATKRDPLLVETDALLGWCQRNASLMAAIIERK